MTDELSREFARLLDQYDDKRRGVEDRRRQVNADQAVFFEGFADVRTRVVRPMFEQLGAALVERGHEFQISEVESSTDTAGKTAEAAISIRIVAAGLEGPARDESQLPRLSFITRHYNKTVFISGSSIAPLSGGAGERKDYRLAEVDRELVERELLRLLTGIVSR